MDEVLESKKKTQKVIEIMRDTIDSAITNQQIAQLNDVGYKAIRKAGV